MMADDNDLPDGGAGSPGETPPGGTTLHDDIARAFDEIETRDAPPETPGATPAPPPKVVGQPPAPISGERARGPDGRFTSEAPPADAKKPPAAPAAAPGANGAKPPASAQKPPDAPKPPADPAAPPPPQLRPPVSWKAGAREHWPKLPTDVQAEVVRREQEVARSMQESANARNALTHVQSVIGPFAQNIAASGSDALTMIQNLMGADNTLRHGSIAQKAELVASIIKSYGVDLQTLDSVLAGQGAQPDPNAALADRMRQEMRAQLQPVMQYFNSMQGQRRNALNQITHDAANEVETFGQDAAHEFYEDVRAEMADIIDLYTQRGASISLQEAYDRAIKLNPHVSEIVAKRAETERASAAAQAAQRAKRTAASLSSAPAPAGAVPGPAGDNRRAAIEAAWDESSGS